MTLAWRRHLESCLGPSSVLAGAPSSVHLPDSSSVRYAPSVLFSMEPNCSFLFLKYLIAHFLLKKMDFNHHLVLI